MTQRKAARPATTQVSMRLPPDTLRRATALIPTVEQLLGGGLVRVERVTVLRLAIDRGLAELEREKRGEGAK